jgi:tetratricopeptide (TPR) repeat protein
VLQRGDLITHVNNEAVTNDERAVVLLRGQPNEKKTVKIVRPGGQETSATLTLKLPGANATPDLINEYGRQIQAHPDDPLFYLLRGLQDTRSLGERFNDLNKAVELNAGFVEALSSRAGIILQASTNKKLQPSDVDKLRDQAQSDLNLANQLDPKNAQVLVQRARAVAALGQNTAGKRDAEKAVELDPSYPLARYILAATEYNLGDYATAAVSARKAIDLNPYHTPNYELLAKIFVKLNRRSDARKTVNAIVDLVSDSKSRDALLKIPDNPR